MLYILHIYFVSFLFLFCRGLQAIIFRYFNVYGSDPKGRLGEYPPPDLRQHGRISGACMDAALGEIEHLTILGTQYVASISNSLLLVNNTA